MKFALIIALSSMLLSGCATSLDGSRYLEQSPEFDLFGFFEGDVRAWGVVQNRSGEVVQRFTVDIRGTVEGATLTLDESFTYGLGEGVQERVWTIEQADDGSYTGSASDILGTAIGESYGNAFRWAYAMDLPVGEQIYRVKFEDWIFALDEQRMINRSYIQKFGLDLAEVTIYMERR
ncbi:MAG: DUF3833 domain-containing protein [Pseudomonadota bacterium]